MPQIQTYEDHVAPQGGLNVQASPNDFGAQIGQATQGFGAAIEGVAEQVHQYNTTQDVTNVYVNMQKARREWTQTLQDRANKAQPGDTTFADGITKDMGDYLQKFSSSVQTPQGKAAFAREAAAMTTDFTTRAIGIQGHLDGEAAKNNYATILADAAVTVSKDITQLDSAVSAAKRAIDDPNGQFGRVDQPTRDYFKQRIEQDAKFAAGNSFVQTPEGAKAYLGSFAPGTLDQFKLAEKGVLANAAPGAKPSISDEAMKWAPQVQKAGAEKGVNSNILLAQLDPSRGKAGGLSSAAYAKTFNGTVLAGQYSTVVAAANKYGVSPSLVAAVMAHETASGTSNMVRTKNNPAGLMDPATGMASGMTFATIEQGIDQAAKTIAKNYQRGGQTIEGMARSYAPVGAANDPTSLNASWPSGVKAFQGRLAGATPAVYNTAPITQEAIDAQAQVMSDMVKRYGGDYSKALAAVNMGAEQFDATMQRWGSAWQSHLPAATSAYISSTLANAGMVPSPGATSMSSETAPATPVADTTGGAPRPAPQSSMPWANGLTYEQTQQLAQKSTQTLHMQMSMETHAREMADYQLKKQREVAMGNYIDRIIDPDNHGGTPSDVEIANDKILSPSQTRELADYKLTRVRELQAAAEPKSNPENVRNLMLQIHAADDDPTKTYNFDPIMAAYRSKMINTGEMKYLRTEVEQLRDGNGSNFAKRTQEAREVVFQGFTRSYMGQADPAKAINAAYSFNQDLQQKIAEYRKENKDPSVLLDKGSRDYFLTPERLNSYGITVTFDAGTQANIQSSQSLANQAQKATAAAKATLPTYQQYDTLKKGEQYTDPQGNVRTKG